METNGGRMADVAAGLEDQAGRLGEQMDALRGYADSADELIRSFARERPLAAVAIAIGIGFLIGRLAART